MFFINKRFQFISLILLLSFSSCAHSIEPQTAQLHVIINIPDTFPPEEEETIFKAVLIPTEIHSSTSYFESKSLVKDIVSKIDTAQISQDSVSRLFTYLLLDKIIPYWYGTEWSFDGHTSKPNEGFIACGYFVSTTLQDVGLNINRYRLAQQAPINEALSLALDEPIITVDGKTISESVTQMKDKLTDGIYFLGLNEGHVGFLLKQNTDLYIIHSNYIGYDGVKIEFVEDSDAFAYCEKFYIVPLSGNKELMKRWLQYEEIKVIRKGI